MKRKNILKFISLLGVGSFVALSATSCKTEKVVNPKPMKPNPAPETGGGSSSGGSSENSSGTNDANTPSTGSGSNNNTGMSSNNDVATKEQATSFLNSLTSDKLEVYKDNTVVTNRKDISVESFEVNKDSIKLKDNTLLPKGWTYGVNLVSNGKNKQDGTIKINVTLTKDGETLTSKDITLNGFQTLATAVASVLFKQQSVKDEDGMMVNKDVLDLGDAKFETLSKLNSNVVIKTDGQPAEAAAPGTSGTMERTSLREEASTTPEASNPPASTTNQEQTTVLGAEFKTLITKGDSPYKIGFDNVKKLYPEFDVDKLYLTGQAKLVSLFKKDSDWKGNYYLVSKQEDNKLSLKLKDNADWSLDIPGLVIQNLLPDDVRISASINNGEEIKKSTSNIAKYKEKINSKDPQNARYSLGDKDNLKIKITFNSKDKYVDVNPIKLPHIAPMNTDNILFKSEYIFDGVAIFDTDFFGTKLIFKKIHNEQKGAKEVLDSEVLNGAGNGVGAITGRMDGDNVADWKSVVQPSDMNYFFSKNDDSKEFIDSIHGEANSKDGQGVVQLTENDTMSNGVNVTKINDGKATTFIIFSRVAYKKTDKTFGYYWPKSVTILYFADPNTATTTTPGAGA
ncbi:hypothetical protein [Mycoplasma bradburyae]|uniref:hypothetical protein n=1 Tax=Mycoplasma bradburyae TaxID=2963128 RepID=UPI0020CBF688|nr:hypothetical protein [Mycoplasma bradburyae]UTS70541.1 hypothetical protein NMG77_02190 [Mycoplasma bradburyae]